MHASDWIAASSVVVAVAALFVAIWAIRKSDKNSSVAMLVALSEAYRSGWQRVVQSIKAIQNDPNGPDTRYTTFSELLNFIEIGCAIINDDALTGFPKKIVNKFLVDSLELIVGNDYAKNQIPRMLTDETTFEHIKTFIKSLRNQPLRFIIPKEWYEL